MEVRLQTSSNGPALPCPPLSSPHPRPLSPSLTSPSPFHSVRSSLPPREDEIYVHVGACTAPGSRYGSLNQDAFMSLKLDHAAYVVGVFDGHGFLGERAAQRASMAIADVVHDKGPSLLDDPSGCLLEAFRDAHARICDLYTVDLPFTEYEYCGHQLYLRKGGKEGGPTLISPIPDPSPRDGILEFGTTAVVAIVIPGRCVVVANCGDSEAYLLRARGAPQRITSTHTASDTNEISRLRRLEHFRPTITSSGHMAATLSPTHGTLQELRSICTRSLGHFHLEKYGLTPEPVVKEMALLPDHTHLVLASDGVFDNLRPREVEKVVNRASSADEAAQMVVAAALQEGEAGDPGLQDNTTCVVVVFRKGKRTTMVP